MTALSCFITLDLTSTDNKQRTCIDTIFQILQINLDEAAIILYNPIWMLIWKANFYQLFYQTNSQYRLETKYIHFLQYHQLILSLLNISIST